MKRLMLGLAVSTLEAAIQLASLKKNKDKVFATGFDKVKLVCAIIITINGIKYA